MRVPPDSFLPLTFHRPTKVPCLPRQRLLGQYMISCYLRSRYGCLCCAWNASFICGVERHCLPTSLPDESDGCSPNAETCLSLQEIPREHERTIINSLPALLSRSDLPSHYITWLACSPVKTSHTLSAKNDVHESTTIYCGVWLKYYPLATIHARSKACWHSSSLVGATLYRCCCVCGQDVCSPARTSAGVQPSRRARSHVW